MEMLNITLGQQLAINAKNYPDRVALKYSDSGFRLTWRELNAEAEAIAKGWLSLGIKKGDHIAIWATNVKEWLLTLFSAAKIGAVLVTVNTNYKIYEAEFLLKQSDTKALVLIDGFKDSDYVAIMNELIPDLKNAHAGKVSSERFPVLERVVYAGEEDKLPNGMLWFDRLKELGKSVSDKELREVMDSLDPHDVINMQYTSGTTGFPKGVMLTHYNILNNGKTIGDGMKFTEEDRLCITVPFFHCFGLVLATMACITHATMMVPVDYFRPVKVLDTLEREQCTAVHGVPTMFIAMLEHPTFEGRKFALRTGIMAGSPCPVEVMKQVNTLMGMRDIVIVFGQTEASPGCTMTTTDDSLEARVNTVGRAFPGVECKIVDPETGEDLPPDTPGEFVARGYNIMKGYYNLPSATEQAIDKDGWLHSGDLCTVDKDGYFKVVGRIKDMIIRGGENIYPKELEDFLYTYPKVKDVQVIGVPSKQYGEEIMAVIILKNGETATEDEIKDYVKEHMARHKTPKYVRFVNAFPQNAAGKIQKYKMREEAIELLKLQEDASVVTA